MTFRSLIFEGLSFQYPQQNLILNQIDFDFPLEQNIRVLGASGVGRSTLFKVLAALATPTAGEYFVNHQRMSHMSFMEFLPYRMHIGYSFDSGGLLNNRNLRDNLLLPLLYHKICSYDQAVQRVDHLLEVFGLSQCAHALPSAVSGGRRKACVIARTFVHEPELVLLDDPTVGIDKEQTEALIDLIKQQRAKGTLLHLYFASRDEHLIKELPHVSIGMTGERIEKLNPRRQVAV